jgi:hypothetical protein
MNAKVNQMVFNNLMKKLEIQPAQTEVERFNEWMKSKVKSIHYSNNNAMCEAYKRIIN